MRALLDIGFGNAVAAALLALLAACVTRWCRRPAIVHALWLLVLLKLVTPPLKLAHLPMQWPAVASAKHPISPAASAAPTRTLNVAPIMKPALVWPEEVAFATPDHLSYSVNQNKPAIPRPAPARAQVFPAVHPKAGAASISIPSTATIVLFVWFAGSLWCAAIVYIRLRRFWSLLRYGSPPTPTIVRRVTALADRLWVSCPKVTFMPGEVCPMVYGIFGRNRLLIPTGLWERLDSSQQASLLAHELAHVRRGDHWVRLLEVIVTILFWWHPVTWWARRELREAEEQCCDAWVVWLLPHAAQHYATALLEAVEFTTRRGDWARPALQMRPAAPVWASGMSEFHRLRRRLVMIKSMNVSHRMSLLGWMPVLALAGLSLPVSPGRAQPSPEPKAAEVAPGDEAKIISDIRATAPVAGSASVGAGFPGGSSVGVAAGDPRGMPGTDIATTPPASVAPMPGRGALSERDRQLEAARMDVKRLGMELASATRRLKDLERATAAQDSNNFNRDGVTRGRSAAPDAIARMPGAPQIWGRKSGTTNDPTSGVGVRDGQYRDLGLPPGGPAPQITKPEMPALADPTRMPVQGTVEPPKNWIAEKPGNANLEKRLAILDAQLQAMSREMQELRAQLHSSQPSSPAARP